MGYNNFIVNNGDIKVKQGDFIINNGKNQIDEEDLYFIMIKFKLKEVIL